MRARAWLSTLGARAALVDEEQAELAAAAIESVIHLVADQHDVRAVGDVGVVHDVDHELVENALTDPAVEDRDVAFDRDIVFREELELNLVDHGSVRFP